MVAQAILRAKPIKKLGLDEVVRRSLVLGNLGSGACSIQNVFGRGK